MKIHAVHDKEIGIEWNEVHYIFYYCSVKTEFYGHAQSYTVLERY